MSGVKSRYIWFQNLWFVCSVFSEALSLLPRKELLQAQSGGGVGAGTQKSGHRVRGGKRGAGAQSPGGGPHPPPGARATVAADQCDNYGVLPARLLGPSSLQGTRPCSKGGSTCWLLFMRTHAQRSAPGGCRAQCLQVRLALPSPWTPAVTGLLMKGSGVRKWRGSRGCMALSQEGRSSCPLQP